MLEKIGLPPKPSMRGAAWVVDASHCQGCSVQFSLFNRKHHCQRCGGLFCSSCTQQRMILRGQGDSPVRICDPCKKLEEAARYELRYGHKNRATRVTPKTASKPEDEILSEILGGGERIQFSQKESLDSELPVRTASSASTSGASSGSKRTSNFSVNENGDESLSAEGQNYELNNTASIFTPEELRQQAVEEKKRYKTLKSEAKPDEALLAFKHGKELERQAAALELELRKSRRMATKAPIVAAVVDTPVTDSSSEAETKKSSAGKRVKKEKNDLASELRELGWSDADLRDETKAAPMSVEGELSQLLKEVVPKSSEGKRTSGIDKSQVNALKRQALLLKREGRLAEAKEELKKAKILEKQLEEQEILGEAEDSDDDLAAIIRNMDGDEHEDILINDPKFPAFNFEQILGASNDLAIDGHFNVTDDDMNDPDMAAALKSFGWSEEDDKQLENYEPVSSNQEVLKEQVLALKREAVANRRSGNVAEAMSLLKKAKLLEKDLEIEEPDSKVSSPEGQKTTRAENVTFEGTNARPVSTSKSKLTIQRELLALKKKALALRREGKVDESEEELKKGSVLEKQLEELENSSKPPVAKETRSFESNPPYKVESLNLNLANEVYEPEVTDNDMQDPALLSVLKNLGWEDAGTDYAERTDKPSISSHVVPQKSSKTKGQLQKELLGIKRRALALRREGKNMEAEQELEKAKFLEQQLAEIEESNNLTASRGLTTADHQITENKYDDQHIPGVDATVHPSSVRKATKGDETLSVQPSESGTSMVTLSGSPSEPQIEATKSKQGLVGEESKDGRSPALLQPAFTDPLGYEKGSSSPSVVHDHKEHQKTHGDHTLKDEILLHKRKAVAFKREGKMAEAREELKLAKLLEKRLEGAQQDNIGGVDGSITPAVEHSSVVQQPASASSSNHTDATASAEVSKFTQHQKAMSSRDRLKIQRESLAHKRNALKLRREGKIAEADAEFELAKELESQLEDSDSQSSSSGGKSYESNDLIVENLLDPQIMSALRSIGWSDMDLSMQPSSAPPPKPMQYKHAQLAEKVEAKSAVAATSKPQSEISQLEEQIKAEKLKALNLKREGKQAEALEALRSAKRMEKELSST